MPKYTFGRDMIFAQLVVILLIVYSLIGKINAFMAGGFILLYAVYVFIALMYERAQNKAKKGWFLL